MMIFALCFTSFSAYGMEEQKETSQFFTKSLEPLLQLRVVKKLSAFCEHAVAKNIKEENNPQETLDTLRHHNEYSLQSILALLSEEKPPKFEKLYHAVRINNVCYSGNNIAWSQEHYRHHYIHTFGVREKEELSRWGGNRGHFKPDNLEGLYISPIVDEVWLPRLFSIPDKYNIKSDKEYFYYTFHPDNVTHALGCENGTIMIGHEIEGTSWTYYLTSLKSKITALKFASNGWLYSSDEDGNTHAWVNIRNNDNWIQHQLPIEKSVVSIAASCDGSVVAFQHATSQAIEIIDWHSLIHKTLKISGELVAITPLNNILVSNNECLELFDLESRKIYSKAIPLRKAQIIQNIAATSQVVSYLVKGKEHEKIIYHSGSWRDIYGCDKTVETMEDKTDDALYISRKFSMEALIEYLEENKK